MLKITRRSMIQTGLGAAAAAWLGAKCLSGSARGNESSDSESFEFEFQSIGKLKTLRSSQIEQSPLSVGFEVLDRRRFEPTRTYEHLANLGVKWARCQTGWNRCERVKGEFTFDWLDEIVESLIEIGVQILNPVQTRARDMDPVFLKKEFGDRIAFWGGVDIQTVLPFGSPEDVRDEVKYLFETLGEGGGWVLCPSHNIQPEVPPENIVAMYEAGAEVGRYG